MGRRSRRREGGEAVAAGTGARRPGRSEARDAEARARLKPLAPGERPTAVTVAAIASALLAVANVALFAAGVDVRGKDPGAGGVVLFAALMVIAAGGMWRARYWAVLAFECLLGVTIVFATLSLVVASNVLAVVVVVAIVAPAGVLFYALVKAMARLQMPERPGPRG